MDERLIEWGFESYINKFHGTYGFFTVWIRIRSKASAACHV